MPAGAAPARRRSTWMIVGLALALPVVVVWGVARSSRGARGPAASPARVPGDPPAPVAGEATSDQDDHHLREVAELVRRSRGNPGQLIDAFAAWASDPQALAARRIVLGALGAQPDPMARLAALLAAVQASPLAPDADPLAREIVSAVSSVWTGSTVRKGRDLMFAEARPHARQVVIASVVELALSDRAAALDASQRAGLTSDFIDLYRQAGEAQRGDIVAVVRKLGGNDTAELLQGHGLRDSQLESHLQYRRDLEAARSKLATTPAAGPP